MFFAFAWSSGVVEFGNAVPPGALEVASGIKLDALREKVSVHARLSHDNTSLLVPGIPETDKHVEKLESLLAFRCLLANV